jgi:hypothetical protein
LENGRRKTGMVLKDSWYDKLKWVAILFLPALSTLISVVFKIWNIPYGDEIAQTITALGVFLGAILGISSIQYKKGNENG